MTYSVHVRREGEDESEELVHFSYLLPISCYDAFDSHRIVTCIASQSLLVLGRQSKALAGGRPRGCDCSGARLPSCGVACV